MKDKLIIFDTTLRDGEQSPGASMTFDEKIRIARQLEKMRVDVIEAGFPAASPGDFKAVQTIAELVSDSIVCGLARANSGDVARAADAVRPAARSRIHTFIATSPIHMKQKLRMQPDEVLAHAVAAVKQARDHTDDVEFSPEDAGRSELDFLCRIIEAAIDAGAGTINIPDTVGYNLPGQFGALIGDLMSRIPNADRAVFSVHCHNDLGLAVANSLSAVMAGARQVECTVNGLGERAGNASLEEIVMAVRTRQDEFACGHANRRHPNRPRQPLGFRRNRLSGAARIKQSSAPTPSRTKPESTKTASSKARETYEIMRAEDVGWAANRIVLGKHSGRAAFTERLKFLGYEFESSEELDRAFARFKELADNKHEIFDDDLQTLVTDTANAEPAKFALKYLETTSTTGKTPTATVVVEVDGEEVRASEAGNGTVDATFSAIESIVKSGSLLQLYSVNAITAGTDAQGEVGVRLEREGRIVNGHGADLDIIIASGKAYINALNKLYDDKTRVHPQLARAI